MADYTQPDVVQKRVRFFDGQFLQDQDFIDEQRYHLDRERRMGLILGLRGIVTGLTVATGATDRLTVGPGTAVDADGRQLVLAADTTTLVLPARQFRGKQGVEVRLVHQALPTDVAQTGGESARRWDESPKVVALTADGMVAVAPDGALPTWDGPSVLLAVVAVGENGDVTVDATGAERAGLGLPGAVGVGTRTPTAPLEIAGTGGGQGIDVLLTGRIRSTSDDGGMWMGTTAFVGGNGPGRIGFFTGRDWRLTVTDGGHVGVGTVSPENAEGWDRVVDVFGATSTKLSVRTGTVEARVLAHDRGFWGAPAGMIAGTRGAHAFSLATGAAARLTVDAGGNVGVGTTTPAARLQVTGRGGSTADVIVNGRVRSANNDGGFEIGDQNRLVGGQGGDRIGLFNTAWRLTVLRNGHIGIGTTDPENSEDWATNVDVTGANAKLSVRTASVDGRVMAHNNGMYGAPGGMITGTRSAHPLSLVTGGAARLTVDTGGNVGIGATTVENAQRWSRVLDVVGGAGVKLSLRTTAVDGRVQAHDGGFWGAPAGMIVGTQTGHALSFGTAGAARLTISATGDVGVGTGGQAPAARLEIGGRGDTSELVLVNGRIRSAAGNDGGLWCATGRFVGAFDDKVGFWNGGAWRLSVDGTGAVGVGGDVGMGGELSVGRNLRVGGDVGVAGKTVLGSPAFSTNSSTPVRLHVGGTTWIDNNAWVRGNLYFWWGPSKQFLRIENWESSPAGDPSDARLKTAVRPITGAVDLVSRLDGVIFRWSDAGVEHLTRGVADSVSAGPAATAEDDAAASETAVRTAVDRLAGDQIGLIAQNVETVAPSLVSTDADGYRRIRYGHLTALLIEAIKEQRSTIDRLGSRLDDLARR